MNVSFICINDRHLLSTLRAGMGWIVLTGSGELQGALMSGLTWFLWMPFLMPAHFTGCTGYYLHATNTSNLHDGRRKR